MDQLNDDAVLEVLKYLPVEDLLKCRLVCKRLSALASHPDLWRRKRLESATPSTLCAVLRIAPCLATLGLQLGREDYCGHLLMTRCAVVDLYLYVTAHSFTLAALVVLRQSLLGGLRSLDVEVLTDSPNGGPYIKFYATLASIAGLESLRVSTFVCDEYFDSSSVAIPLLHSIAVPSSIRVFEWETRTNWATNLDGFVGFVLSRHAATLESIAIVGSGSEDREWKRTFPLLAGLPKLRALSLDTFGEPLPRLEALAAWNSLTSLTLYVYSSMKVEPELFRGARHLREVILRPLGPPSVGDVVKLIPTLTSSCIELLSINWYQSNFYSNWIVDCDQLTKALVEALPWPRLRQLIINWTADELRQSITPETAPALQTVRHGPYKEFLFSKNCMKHSQYTLKEVPGYHCALRGRTDHSC